MSQWLQVRPIIDEMVNRQFDTAEFKKLFAVPLTPGRVKVYQNHMTYYTANRRDCWSFVAGKAPLDVKRAIWEHEKDELIFDKRMGSAHLTDEQMAAAAAESTLLPGVRAALMAWMFLSTTRPWIEALTVNHITERKNNPAIVKGGGFTARFAHKRVADQGGTIEGLDINTKVHMVADEDHSDMFEPIYDRHIIDARMAESVIRAAQDSLDIDRAYRSALATAMAQIAESAAA